MRIGIWFFIVVLTASVPVFAEIRPSAHTQAELVSEVTSLQPGRPVWLALRLRMDPEWHTYWRNPGDSGMATSVAWELPPGFSAGLVQWPYPERIDIDPVTVYAYEGEVLLLTQLTVPSDLPPEGLRVIRAKAEWLECKIECVPGRAELSLELPVAAGVPEADDRWVETFAQTRAKLPLPHADWQVTAEADSREILFQIEPPRWADYSLGPVEFFPYTDSLISHSASQVLRSSGRGAFLSVKRSALSLRLPERIRGVLVAREGWRGRGSEAALEIDVPVRLSGRGPGSLPWALLFAFMGGLILNLMPCVLPILSLKILNFVKQASEQKAAIWKHGLVFSAGVLLSFWILAGLLLLLRGLGHQVGWGFHLQSPVFLVLLIHFFFILALNVFGIFEIGVSLTGLGGDWMSRAGYGGSFASGILATVVATPCTAPFMGSALAFALTQPAWVALLIFTSLGAGMAFPYLVLSFFPRWLSLIPKPGPWLMTFKKVMGLLLALTAAWLIRVLLIQIGSSIFPALLAGFLLIGIGLFVYGRQSQRSPGRIFGVKFFPALLVLSLGFLGLSLPLAALRGPRLPEEKQAVKQSGIPWENFSEERLESLLAEGKPVFLDFTAAWCLTCYVNERLVLDSPEVQEKFGRLGVTPLKADWTSRDEKITRALAGYGRSSIPLYVLYGPGPGAEPVILPEIITPGMVLDALQTLTEGHETRDKRHAT